MFGTLFITGGIVMVDAIDGYGTVNFIPKFLNGEVIGNSSLIDDLSSPLNLSLICTSSNGLCGSGGNGTTFINTTYNITNNITQNITNSINNTFIVNESKYIINFTHQAQGNDENLTIYRADGVNFSVKFTDSDTTYSASECIILSGTSFLLNISCTNQYYYNVTNLQQFINDTFAVLKYKTIVDSNNDNSSNNNLIDTKYNKSNPQAFINLTGANIYNYSSIIALDNSSQNSFIDSKLNKTWVTNTSRCDPTSGKLIQVNWSNGLLVGECGVDQTGGAGSYASSSAGWVNTSNNTKTSLRVEVRNDTIMSYNASTTSKAKLTIEGDLIPLQEPVLLRAAATIGNGYDIGSLHNARIRSYVMENGVMLTSTNYTMLSNNYTLASPLAPLTSLIQLSGAFYLGIPNDFLADGKVHNIKLYSYVAVDNNDWSQGFVMSENYTNLTYTDNNNLDHYRILWGWLRNESVTGYVVVKTDPYRSNEWLAFTKEEACSDITNNCKFWEFNNSVQMVTGVFQGMDTGRWFDGYNSNTTIPYTSRANLIFNWSPVQDIDGYVIEKWDNESHDYNATITIPYNQNSIIDTNRNLVNSPLQSSPSNFFHNYSLSLLGAIKGDVDVYGMLYVKNLTTLNGDLNASNNTGTFAKIISNELTFSSTVRSTTNNFYFNSTTGKLFVGTNGDYATTGTILAYGDYDSYRNQSTNVRNSTTDNYAGLSISTSRGSGFSPLQSAFNDFIGGLRYYFYNGTQFIAGAEISSSVTVNTTSANLDFRTGGTSRVVINDTNIFSNLNMTFLSGSGINASYILNLPTSNVASLNLSLTAAMVSNATRALSDNTTQNGMITGLNASLTLAMVNNATRTNNDNTTQNGMITGLNASLTLAMVNNATRTNNDNTTQASQIFLRDRQFWKNMTYQFASRTISINTTQNNTELTIYVPANQESSLDCFIYTSTAAATTGVWFNVSFEGTASVDTYIRTGTSTTAYLECSGSQFTTCQPASSAGGTTSETHIISNINASVGGNFSVFIKPEVTASNILLRPSSQCRLYEWLSP